jgi:hypothetical protein
VPLNVPQPAIAKEFIPKGTIVYEFINGIDIKMSDEKFNNLNIVQQEYFKKLIEECRGNYTTFNKQDKKIAIETINKLYEFI